MANPYDQFDAGNPYDRFDRKPKTRGQLRLDNPTEYDSTSPEFQAKYGPQAVPVGENVAAAADKFITDIGTGAKQRLGMVGTDQVAEQRRLDAPLMGTKAGKAGYLGAGLLTAAPALAIPGVNTVAGAGAVGALTGALQPTVEGESPLVNATVGGTLGAGGQAVAKGATRLIANRIANKTAAKAAEQAENATRDATLKAARAAGYVTPPAATNPTIGNKILESVAGKAATRQQAELTNQRVTNRLVREDLGMAPRSEITINALKNIRTMAGSVYKDIKATGDIATDGKYLNELVDLTRSADEVAKDFPDLNFASSEQIKKLQDGLQLDKFSANSALEAIKQLRKEATGNLAWNVEDPAKKALGLAQREAAGIIEDQVIRSLNAAGKADLAGKFDKARTTIAKTYSVQAALNDTTGNVVATKLAAQLRKGKPLTGGIEKAARFAAATNVGREQLTSPGVSALGAGVAGAGLATGHPGMLGIPLARAVARPLILSGAYQNRMMLPNYAPRTGSLRGLGSGAKLLPAAGVVLPGYLGQQGSF